MTDYTDFKLEPELSSIVIDVAEQQYGRAFRAQSRAGHEALVLWLVFRADPSVRREVLTQHGFDSIADLVSYLADDDGRFSDDDQFDPLAGVETPRDMDDQDTNPVTADD